VSAFDLDASKHHDEFRRIDLKVAIGGSGQLLKGSAFESLGPDRKPVIVPRQYLDVVPLAVEEHKQVTGEEVDIEVRFDQSRQTAKPFPHVGRGGVNEDPRGRCDRNHEATSAVA